VQPQAAEPAADGFLGAVSDESLEVLQHFGPEAPALLNRYACTVEDALLAQAQQSNQALAQLQQLGEQLQQMEVALNATVEDNKAYNALTTDPELLAEYVNEFFGPDGPVPVEIEEDRLRADVQAATPAYQRPQMPMPAPGAQGGGGSVSADDFWNTFNQVATTRPQDLYKLLDAAQVQAPDLLASKVLISTGE
jgi:hypothetical protein